MYEPRPPRPMPLPEGYGLLDTFLVAVGTTCLFFVATLAALVAASAVTAPLVATVLGLLVAGATLVGAALGVRLAIRRVRERLSSKRTSSLAPETRDWIR